MQYVIFILLGIILSFSTVYLYNLFILKNAGKENLKISFLFVLFSVPIGIAILIIMFLCLKLANWILPVDISNYKIFIISFASVFIIFIGEFIIKMLVSSMISRYFSKRYRDVNLSQAEMFNMIEQKQGFIQNLKLISMFLISYIIYIMIANILNIESTMFIVTISSIVSSILYFFMFKSK